MREKADQSGKSNKHLRKRAEELLKEKSREENQLKPKLQAEDHNLKKTSKSAGVDTKLLIHELQVHQIELERQNEELRRAQLELEEAKNKYAELYNFAPVGYLTLNEKCTVLEANFTACHMLDLEKQNLIKRNFSRYIDQEHSDVFYSYRKRLIDTGTRQVCELRILKNDGTSFYAQLEGLASFDTEGEFSHFKIAMHDVTKRKQAEEILFKAHGKLETIVQEQGSELIKTKETLQSEVIQRAKTEEALRDSEEEYKDLFGNIPIGIYRTTPDGRILKANTALIRMLGYSSFDELASHNLEELDFQPSYDRNKFKELIKSKNEVIGFESVWTRRDGTPFFVRENARAVRGRDGAIWCYEGTVEDITEHKLAEEKFRIALESAPNGIAMVDQKGIIMFANTQVEKLFGYAKNELLGQSIEVLVPERFRSNHSKFRLEFHGDPRARPMGAGRDLFALRKDGSEFPVEIGLNPVKTADGIIVLSSIVDITERKRAEEKLTRYAKQQTVIAKLWQSALMGTGLAKLMDEATALVAQTLEVEYCKLLELLPDGDSLLLRSGAGWKEGYVGHATVGSGADSQGGYTLTCRAPVVVDDLSTETRFSVPPLLRDHSVTSGISVIIHGEKQPFGVLGAHTTKRRKFDEDDVNFIQAVANILSEAIERKRAEEALRENEQKLKAIMSNTTDAILVFDEDGRIITINKKGESLFSGDSKKRPESIWDTISSEERIRFSEKLKSVKEGNKLLDYEMQRLLSNGDKIPVSVGLVYVPEGVGWFIETVRDVRERVALRNKIIELEKAQIIGKMAEGIAHHMGTPLASMLLRVQMLKEDVPSAFEYEKYLEKLDSIERQIFYTQKVIQRLLRFVSKPQNEKYLDNVSNILDDAAEITNPLFKNRGIKLELKADEDLYVLADSNLLGLVFVDIMMNALDAMPEGGKLSVIASGGIREGVIEIIISDTGSGIPRDILPFVFEPFFTTKPAGKGTGLGLSVAKRIIHDHGGEISIDSTEGKGTSVIVKLPAQAEGKEIEQA